MKQVTLFIIICAAVGRGLFSCGANPIPGSAIYEGTQIGNGQHSDEGQTNDHDGTPSSQDSSLPAPAPTPQKSDGQAAPSSGSLIAGLPKAHLRSLWLNSCLAIYSLDVELIGDGPDSNQLEVVFDKKQLKDSPIVSIEKIAEGYIWRIDNKTILAQSPGHSENLQWTFKGIDESFTTQTSCSAPIEEDISEEASKITQEITTVVTESINGVEVTSIAVFNVRFELTKDPKSSQKRLQSIFVDLKDRK